MIVLAVFYGLDAILAFVGNLFVLLVVITQHSFHNMRYFLLASLALSDFLFAVLITSNRTIATALEEWIFGTAWCHGAAYLIRVLHFSTVLHLCAFSYERYSAIVRKPLTYDGHITKTKFFQNIFLLWIVPAVISLGPLIGWGDYVYNPDIFACEQKWDKQTTIPLLVTSFLAPLGVIFILNYKVLKVVAQLQHSFKIIDFQPNETQDHQNQQQRANEDQDTSRSKGDQQHQDEQIKELGMVNMKARATNHNSEIRCYENAAYHEEPDDMLEAIGQEDLAGQSGGNVNSAQYQSFRRGIKRNNRSSAQTTEDSPRKNNKKTVENGCPKAERDLYQEEKQPTRPETVDRYQPNSLAKMELQIHIIKDRESTHQRVENQKRNERGKGKVTPKNEVQNIDFAKTEASQELKSQFTEHQLQGDKSDPMANPVRKITQQPGKTQIRISMLLKEGKAAKDVMIIISAFLLCYLPLWIMALCRSLGKEPSVEAILATHGVYCTTMVWNPIIYSVRKKEFRKALKKLLKL